MRKVWGLFTLLVGFTLGVAGCKADSDIGNECILVKKGAADAGVGDTSNQIREGELNQNQDYVSFGATECENFTCVRRAGTPLTGGPNDLAKGICSKNCLPDADIEEQCPPADSDLILQCRPLILDRETLAALRQENPGLYQQTFGDNTQPDFCVIASKTGN